MSQNYYAEYEENVIINANNTAYENYFLKYNNLSKRFNELKPEQVFVIGELDFGYGCNFLDTCELWSSSKSLRKQNSTLHYLSFLAQPIQPTQLAQFLNNSIYKNEISAQLIQQYNLLLPGYHRLSFSHNIMLTLIIGNNHHKLNEINHHINAWYLNPQPLIDDNLALHPNNCQELGRLSTSNTSCVIELEPTAIALANLISVGFNLQQCHARQQGCQVFSGNYSPSKLNLFKSRHLPTYYKREHTTTAKKQIAIIGAGISGATTAFSLAKRGYTVTVYEKNPEPAMEASGNYQGMVYASWSAFGGAIMELSCAAYRYAHNLITTHLTLDVDYAACGLIQLGHTVEQIRRNQQIISAHYLPPDFLTSVNHEQIAAIAGVELNVNLSGVYYPSGLWLNPPSLIKTLLQHPNITLITNSQIKSIEQIDNKWQLFNPQDKLIDQADCLVLCNAHYINQFKPTANLSIRKIRGQISIVSQPSQLKTILCGAGYITPNKANKFTLGATFQFNDNSSEIRSQDHQLNLANLSTILPTIAQQIDPAQLTGQTNFRASPHDYLPVVGPIAKYAEFKHDYAKLSQDKNARISPICQYHQGLYLNLGHGAKGLLTAPLSGEIIADYIAGTPLACSETLRTALHPNRLYVHELVHRTKPIKQN